MLRNDEDRDEDQDEDGGDEDRDEDRDEDEGGTEMGLALGHEKLRVYQRGLDYASWTHSTLANIEQSAAVLDHWDRAAESIVENLANGNSRHAAADRNRYFDFAFGSALECAACLDICVCKKLIMIDRQDEGKVALQQIVKMTIGLRKSRSSYVKEEREEYIAGQNDEIYFAHEGLDVYKVALSPPRLDPRPDLRRLNAHATVDPQ